MTSPKPKKGKTHSPPKPKPSSNKSVPPSKNSTSVSSEPKSENTFVTFWWMSQSPYMAEFDNRASAEAAANVRNALMLTITGTVEEAVDWYRRDDKGLPMPVERRDITGHVGPWGRRAARSV